MNRDNNIEPNKNPFMPPTSPYPQRRKKSFVQIYISPSQIVLHSVERYCNILGLM